MKTGHDRFELSVRFNKAMSDEGYRAAREQMLMNAQPAWIYSENNSQRQITVKCMLRDERGVKARIEKTPGVTSVHAFRREMGPVAY